MTITIVKHEKPERFIIISGNTYPLRNHFIRIRAKWNKLYKEWTWKCPYIDELNFEINYLKSCDRNVIVKKYEPPRFFFTKTTVPKPVIQQLCREMPEELVEIINNKTENHNCTCKPQQNFMCAMCRYACCPKAKRRHCVCTVAFYCEDHGYRCIGNHD